MPRILIFSTAYFPHVGGAEIAVREFTKRMPDFEFDLVTARLRRGLPDTEIMGRVRVHRVGFGSPVDKFLLPWLAGRRAEALHMEKCFDATWSIMASYAGFATERFKRRYPDVPMLLTLQEGDPPEDIAKKVRFVRTWFRNIFRRADALQTISRFLMEWGRAWGFEGDLAEVIPNGVDVGRFSVMLEDDERLSIRHEHGIPEGAYVIVTASRLVVKNGIDLLIRALSELPSRVVLLIAGGGGLETELKNLARELDVDGRVVFAGHVSHEKLPKLLAGSDVFCRPSRSEGMGNAFVEAMATGIPVIGTDVGGIPDVIEDGKNGLLIAPESSGAVVEAVRRCMDDVALRERLVRGGFDKARSMDWDVLAPKMTALFRKLIV